MVATERDDTRRKEWRAENASLDATRLVIVDETSTSVALTRRYGWAPSQERASGKAPRNHGQPTTLVASLTKDGLGPAMTLQGALDTEAFHVDVRDFLAPSLRPGQVVPLDNLSAHKAEVVRDLIAERQCQLLYLPPYSPDYSPIELAFSKLKAFLRQVQARTQEALDDAIHRTMDLITPDESRAFIKHCGYRFPSEP